MSVLRMFGWVALAALMSTGCVGMRGPKLFEIDLRITDADGKVAELKDAQIWGPSGNALKLTDGIGNWTIPWQNIQRVDMQKPATDRGPIPCSITFFGGEKKNYWISSEFYVTGKTQLGGYQIDYDKISVIENATFDKPKKKQKNGH